LLHVGKSIKEWCYGWVVFSSILYVSVVDVHASIVYRQNIVPVYSETPVLVRSIVKQCTFWTSASV